MRNFFFSSLLCAMAGAFAIPASAQLCLECGDGSAGAFSATSDMTLPGGTYDYTTFNIDAGVTVTVTGPDPLIIRATGAVTINGSLVANGGVGGEGVTLVSGGLGAVATAGGAAGGDGIYSDNEGPLDGTDGSGPGGGGKGQGWSGAGGGGYGEDGQASGGVGGLAGIAYGSPDIPMLLGGSGGGGGSGGYGCGSGGGGAGGGAIAIQSCTSILVGAGAVVSTNGGNGGSDGTGNCGGGGGASGGSVVLDSPDLTIAGSVSSLGGTGGASTVSGSPYFGTGGNGGKGRILIETAYPPTISGTVDPAAQTNSCPFDRIFVDGFELPPPN